MPVFARHNELVWEQRKAALMSHPLGTLVAGGKKDVVLTPQLAAKPGKVAIYGWHRVNGVAIQPLYLGHRRGVSTLAAEPLADDARRALRVLPPVHGRGVRSEGKIMHRPAREVALHVVG